MCMRTCEIRNVKRDSAMAVITPSGDPAWVESLWPLLHRGVAPTAILLGLTSFVGQGDLSPVRSVLAGAWQFRVTPLGRVVVVRRPREAVP